MRNFFTIGRTILWLSGIIIVAALWFWWFNEITRERDADRLADMRYIHAGMAELYSDTNSYASAADGCAADGSVVSQCHLQDYLDKIDEIVDPGNGRYLVTGTPDDNGYEITFTLEKSYNELSAGTHTLTQDGIQ